MIDPYEFMNRANSDFLAHKENQRYGQFLMNQLQIQHPEIIVPEEVDCFYDNDKVPSFLNFLYRCAT
jgi:hypothetical protein